jgi:hypothetical protein
MQICDSLSGHPVNPRERTSNRHLLADTRRTSSQPAREIGSAH